MGFGQFWNFEVLMIFEFKRLPRIISLPGYKILLKAVARPMANHVPR